MKTIKKNSLKKAPKKINAISQELIINPKANYEAKTTIDFRDEFDIGAGIFHL